MEENEELTELAEITKEMVNLIGLATSYASSKHVAKQLIDHIGTLVVPDQLRILTVCATSITNAFEATAIAETIYYLRHEVLSHEFAHFFTQIGDEVRERTIHQIADYLEERGFEKKHKIREAIGVLTPDAFLLHGNNLTLIDYKVWADAGAAVDAVHKSYDIAATELKSAFDIETKVCAIVVQSHDLLLLRFAPTAGMNFQNMLDHYQRSNMQATLGRFNEIVNGIELQYYDDPHYRPTMIETQIRMNNPFVTKDYKDDLRANSVYMELSMNLMQTQNIDLMQIIENYHFGTPASQLYTLNEEKRILKLGEDKLKEEALKIVKDCVLEGKYLKPYTDFQPPTGKIIGDAFNDLESKLSTTRKFISIAEKRSPSQHFLWADHFVEAEELPRKSDIGGVYLSNILKSARLQHYLSNAKIITAMEFTNSIGENTDDKYLIQLLKESLPTYKNAYETAKYVELLNMDVGDLERNLVSKLKEDESATDFLKRNQPEGVNIDKYQNIKIRQSFMNPMGMRCKIGGNWSGHEKAITLMEHKDNSELNEEGRFIWTDDKVKCIDITDPQINDGIHAEAKKMFKHLASLALSKGSNNPVLTELKKLNLERESTFMQSFVDALLQTKACACLDDVSNMTRGVFMAASRNTKERFRIAHCGTGNNFFIILPSSKLFCSEGSGLFYSVSISDKDTEFMSMKGSLSVSMWGQVGRQKYHIGISKPMRLDKTRLDKLERSLEIFICIACIYAEFAQENMSLHGKEIANTEWFQDIIGISFYSAVSLNKSLITVTDPMRYIIMDCLADYSNVGAYIREKFDPHLKTTFSAYCYNRLKVSSCNLRSYKLQVRVRAPTIHNDRMVSKTVTKAEFKSIFIDDLTLKTFESIIRESSLLYYTNWKGMHSHMHNLITLYKVPLEFQEKYENAIKEKGMDSLWTPGNDFSIDLPAFLYTLVQSYRATTLRNPRIRYNIERGEHLQESPSIIPTLSSSKSVLIDITQTEVDANKAEKQKLNELLEANHSDMTRIQITADIEAQIKKISSIDQFQKVKVDKQGFLVVKPDKKAIDEYIKDEYHQHKLKSTKVLSSQRNMSKIYVNDYIEAKSTKVFDATSKFIEDKYNVDSIQLTHHITNSVDMLEEVDSELSAMEYLEFLTEPACQATVSDMLEKILDQGEDLLIFQKIFEKMQRSQGDREIYMSNYSTKVVMYVIEHIYKHFCKIDRSEMISEPGDKKLLAMEKDGPKTYNSSNRAHINSVKKYRSYPFMHHETEKYHHLRGGVIIPLTLPSKVSKTRSGLLEEEWKKLKLSSDPLDSDFVKSVEGCSWCDLHKEFVIESNTKDITLLPGSPKISDTSSTESSLASGSLPTTPKRRSTDVMYLDVSPQKSPKKSLSGSTLSKLSNLLIRRTSISEDISNIPSTSQHADGNKTKIEEIRDKLQDAYSESSKSDSSSEHGDIIDQLPQTMIDKKDVSAILLEINADQSKWSASDNTYKFILTIAYNPFLLPEEKKALILFMCRYMKKRLIITDTIIGHLITQKQRGFRDQQDIFDRMLNYDPETHNFERNWVEINQNWLQGNFNYLSSFTHGLAMSYFSQLFTEICNTFPGLLWVGVDSKYHSDDNSTSMSFLYSDTGLFNTLILPENKGKFIMDIFSEVLKKYCITVNNKKTYLSSLIKEFVSQYMICGEMSSVWPRDIIPAIGDCSYQSQTTDTMDLMSHLQTAAIHGAPPSLVSIVTKIVNGCVNRLYLIGENQHNDLAHSFKVSSRSNLPLQLGGSIDLPQNLLILGGVGLSDSYKLHQILRKMTGKIINIHQPDSIISMIKNLTPQQIQNLDQNDLFFVKAVFYLYGNKDTVSLSEDTGYDPISLLPKSLLSPRRFEAENSLKGLHTYKIYKELCLKKIEKDCGTTIETIDHTKLDKVILNFGYLTCSKSPLAKLFPLLSAAKYTSKAFRQAMSPQSPTQLRIDKLSMAKGRIIAADTLQHYVSRINRITKIDKHIPEAMEAGITYNEACARIKGSIDSNFQLKFLDDIENGFNLLKNVLEFCLCSDKNIQFWLEANSFSEVTGTRYIERTSLNRFQGLSAVKETINPPSKILKHALYPVHYIVEKDRVAATERLDLEAEPIKIAMKFLPNQDLPVNKWGLPRYHGASDDNEVSALVTDLKDMNNLAFSFLTMHHVNLKVLYLPGKATNIKELFQLVSGSRIRDNELMSVEITQNICVSQQLDIEDIIIPRRKKQEGTECAEALFFYIDCVKKLVGRDEVTAVLRTTIEDLQYRGKDALMTGLTTNNRELLSFLKLIMCCLWIDRYDISKIGTDIPTSVSEKTNIDWSLNRKQAAEVTNIIRDSLKNKVKWIQTNTIRHGNEYDYRGDFEFLVSEDIMTLNVKGKDREISTIRASWYIDISKKFPRSTFAQCLATCDKTLRPPIYSIKASKPETRFYPNIVYRAFRKKHKHCQYSYIYFLNDEEVSLATNMDDYDCYIMANLQTYGLKDYPHQTEYRTLSDVVEINFAWADSQDRSIDYLNFLVPYKAKGDDDVHSQMHEQSLNWKIAHKYMRDVDPASYSFKNQFKVGWISWNNVFKNDAIRHAAINGGGIISVESFCTWYQPMFELEWFDRAIALPGVHGEDMTSLYFEPATEDEIELEVGSIQFSHFTDNTINQFRFGLAHISVVGATETLIRSTEEMFITLIRINEPGYIRTIDVDYKTFPAVKNYFTGLCLYCGLCRTVATEAPLLLFRINKIAQALTAYMELKGWDMILDLVRKLISCEVYEKVGDKFVFTSFYKKSRDAAFICHQLDINSENRLYSKLSSLISDTDIFNEGVLKSINAQLVPSTTFTEEMDWASIMEKGDQH